MNEQLVIQQLTRAEIASSKTAGLLETSGLPVDDLDQAEIALWGAFSDRRLAGVIGLETCGSAILLRSLAVQYSFRGKGLAKRLTQIAINEATDLGHHNIYLLTETASDFFRKFGFKATNRAAAPAGIRATQQFSSLCPDSARLMRRTLKAR